MVGGRCTRAGGELVTEILIHRLWALFPQVNSGIGHDPQKLYTGCAQGYAQVEAGYPQVVHSPVHRPAWLLTSTSVSLALGSRRAAATAPPIASVGGRVEDCRTRR
jgi:hypothetical protein